MIVVLLQGPGAVGTLVSFGLHLRFETTALQPTYSCVTTRNSWPRPEFYGHGGYACVCESSRVYGRWAALGGIGLARRSGEKRRPRQGGAHSPGARGGGQGLGQRRVAEPAPFMEPRIASVR